jgi:hypothetical protein
MTDQKQTNSAQIIVAVIGAIGLIIVACIEILPHLINPTPAPIMPTLTSLDDTPTEASLKIRIANDKNEALQGAKVVVTTDQGLYSQISDANGNASLAVSFQQKEARIFVEASQYMVYDQIILLPANNSLDLRLSLSDPNNREVIIRISNSSNNLPVAGAEITLIVLDKIYSQPTDSNGLTRFSLAFGDKKDEIDVDLSVKTQEYDFKHLRITLQAEHLQDLRIDSTGISTGASSTIVP